MQRLAPITCCAFASLLNRTAAFHIQIPAINQLFQRDMMQHLPIAPSHCSPYHSSTQLKAAPKRGSIVESYQTVSVNCSTCRTRLFRYKKKNGTKSNLIKCYVERIVEAEDAELEESISNFANLTEDYKWCCPGCGANFARGAMIRGLPALKLAGGKTRMTKK